MQLNMPPTRHSCSPLGIGCPFTRVCSMRTRCDRISILARTLRTSQRALSRVFCTTRKQLQSSALYVSSLTAEVSDSVAAQVFFIPWAPFKFDLGRIADGVVGSGDRSRQFRLRSQRNLKDGGGGPDHVAMLRQMAAVHPRWTSIALEYGATLR